MAITFFTEACVERNRLAHTVAPCVDFVIGLALVIIGILGTQSVIPLSGNAAYALVGTGSAYAGFFLLIGLLTCKKSMACTEDLYLFKKPPYNFSEFKAGD